MIEVWLAQRFPTQQRCSVPLRAWLFSGHQVASGPEQMPSRPTHFNICRQAGQTRRVGRQNAAHMQGV